jgi:transcriptional regulator with XRE-family HTH domain
MLILLFVVLRKLTDLAKGLFRYTGIGVAAQLQVAYGNPGRQARGKRMPLTFGHKIRELRKAKGQGQRAVAAEVGINFTYLSKIENDRVDFAAFPSEETIRKLAKVLDADVDELLLMAKKIPDHIRQRVLERPDAFRMIAKLDDRSLDRLVKTIKFE